MAGKTINLNLLFLLMIILPTTTHPFSTKYMNTAPVPKTTYHQFYFFDKPSQPNPTAIPIVAGPNNSNTPPFFGRLEMIDDPLFAGQRISSKIIGRAQGMFGGADMNTIGLMMVVNYVFTAGKYNGSTLSILGRNEVMQSTREMPIIGGTGKFRFAQGFAMTRTMWFRNNGDAMVQYNVTVYHYPNLKF